VNKPDGIFAVNDATALGVLKIAKLLGVKVPDEIKIVGFENSKSSVFCSPELTTVDQFGYELGKTATTLLLERINANSYNYKTKKIVVKPKLIVRGTS